MRESAIRKFLLALGCDNFQATEKWLNCRCPLAAYTHSGGVDQHPSFGVSISEDNRSVYWCFGCAQGARSLSWLLHNLFVMTGRYPWSAAGIFRKEEIHDGKKVKVAAPDPFVGMEKSNTAPLPYKVLRKYKLLQFAQGYEARRCRFYLEQERGIPEWVQNLCRVRYDEDNQALVFPLTDVHGNTFLLRERLRKKKKIWTVTPELVGLPELTFPRLADAGAWFGMFLIDWTRPVMLVEAEMEAMRLIALGYFNVIASATSNVTDAQLDALHTDTLILAYDADKSGRHAHARIRDRMEGKASMLEANWAFASACRKNEKLPEKWDPGELRNQGELRAVLSRLKVVI